MLVLPAKIFEFAENAIALPTIHQRLIEYHDEDQYTPVNGETVALVSEVLELQQDKNSISGIFSRDFITPRQYRRDLVEIPVTEEAPFWIKSFDTKTYLIVMAPSVARGVRKLLTSHVANKLSDVIFFKPWSIREARLSPETLKELHESNPQATKLIWFDDVDIPSVDKLCLAGSSLADTKLYQEYLQHGTIWYVVFEVQRRQIVVGITRNCVVTLFSKSTVDDFINYILDDLIPLI
jgi:hypothetical protein